MRLTRHARPTGAGESGKSTVLKQMKLIYSQGFSKNEKLEWKPVIFSNIVQSFKVIAEAMNEHDLQFDNPDNEVSQAVLPHYDCRSHYSDENFE